MSDQRFTFGLERVRELRVHAEDRAREDLAASLAVQSRGEALLAAADARLAAALSGSPEDAASADGLSGPALVAWQAWRDRLVRGRAAAALDLRRCEAEVDVRRRALVEAGRDRETLERLKERQKAEHTLAAARRESAHLDEIALNAHTRRSGA